MGNYYLLYLVGILFISRSHPAKNRISITGEDRLALKQVETNVLLVNEGLERCRRFVTDWLALADSTTGLIPKNLNKGSNVWNAKEAGADNYPFMLLTATLTDENLFKGRLLDMLHTKTRLTSGVGNLPDTYSFKKKGFETP